MSDEYRLEAMWMQQVEFVHLLQQKRNFPKHPVDIASKQGQQLLENISFNVMKEMFEAVQHLKNAKTHRATEVCEFDREAFKEELVDTLHYFFELAIMADIDLDELYESYMKKGVINTDRINNGY